ncbi:MAG: hypothetical protein CL920_05285 [Deltaproteobacteria bacterium]|nr:hypothetical protein [Deltaproteobacteria bacterium]MBU48095.1 hypothetical protein [Deltaproteobacteria bacterium]|tara:strand:- start:16473 stop:18134 length:1662 start_codon:yes stop_codon:yes gene_type:complete
MSHPTSPSSEPKILGGQYRIVNELGAGGMGKIFYGIHILTEQPVAIKMLHSELLSDEVIRERFLTEAKTLARLEHQNIVQWKNSVEDETGCYLIMQFVEGDNVEDRIREHKKLPLEDAITIAMASLAGLSYVHSKDVIHRDLKPSNILLSKDNEVKLADFGIARITGTKRQTQAGMAVGTFLYMSPEQILAGEIDHRTDIYSMGITLFEMLTGMPPFQGDTEFEVCKKHLEENLPSLRKLNASLPVNIETILKKATAKDPKKRYQSADEFLAALTEAFPECAVKASHMGGFSAPHTNVLLSSLQSQQPAGKKKKGGCFGKILWTLVILAAIFGAGYWLYFNVLDTYVPPKPKKESTTPNENNKLSKVSLPYNETFEAQNVGDWPTGEQFSAALSLQAGAYQIKTKDGKKMTTVCPGKLTAVKAPLSLSFSSKVNSSSKEKRAVHGIALFFHLKEKRSQGYYIGIDPPKQQATIARLVDGTWHYLRPWSNAPTKPTQNELSMTLKENTLQVTLNGTKLPAVKLKAFDEGRTCLFVQRGGTDITFKRFTVKRPAQ